MNTRPLTRITMLLIVVSLGVAGAVSPAAATSHQSRVQATQNVGWVRFGHFAPSAQAVNVLADGAPFAANISFKTVSDYIALPAGPHRFQLKSTADPNGATLLEVSAGVADGAAVTIGAVTTRDGVAAQVYDDALASPPAGQSLVRFVHTAPDVAAVDVQVVGGPTLATDIPYPAATAYQSIAPGQYNVEVRPAGSTDVLLKVDGWSVQAGSQVSIIILRGLDGKIDVAPVRDGVAVASAPAGGVQTGFGGMSGAVDSGNTRSPWRILGPISLAAVALGMSGIRRARRWHLDS